MTIELSRNLLKMDQVVAEESSQALVEGDVVVPDSKPDMAKVLDVRGAIVVSGREVVQDRVMAEGTIQYSILYVADEEGQPIESMEGETSFTQYLDMPGVKPKMIPKLKVDIEHIDYDVLNSRKVNVKSVLNMSAQVNQAVQLEAVQDFKGLEDIQVLKDRIRITNSGGEGSSQTIIRENVELPEDMPSVEAILRNDSKARIVERKVADNKVIVHGELTVGILYLCAEEEEPLHYFNQDIPFSHFVEIPGAYQGMDCEADVEVQEVYIEVKENLTEENRILDIEVVMGFNAQIFEMEDKEIVVDAYSPSANLKMNKRKVSFKQMVGENQAQASIKQSVTFPSNAPEADRILYVDAKPIVTDQAIVDGKVIIEGILAADVIYQYQDDRPQIQSLKEEIPFRQSVEVADISDEMDCSSQIEVEQSHFNLIAPDEVELRIVVNAKSSVYRTVEKEVLVGAEEVEAAQAEDSGIYIYFVQPGDSLWTIAKRYNTTIANILNYNDMEDHENLQAGSKLVIYKKYEYKIS